MIDIRPKNSYLYARYQTWRLSRRGGSRLDVTTVFRWALHRQRGVTLETVKIGGQRCTSIGALQRFFGALSGSDRKIAPAQSAGRQHMAKSSPATQARLDALGI